MSYSRHRWDVSSLGTTCRFCKLERTSFRRRSPSARGGTTIVFLYRRGGEVVPSKIGLVPPCNRAEDFPEAAV